MNNDRVPTRKLSSHWPLQAKDRKAINDLTSRASRSIAPGTDLFSQGDHVTSVYFLLEGWAARYKVLEDGRRQIVSFVLPGDLCDPYCFLLDRTDHSVGAITTLRVVEVTRPVLEEIARRCPDIAKALWVNSLVTASIQREWCVNIGQRTAFERISHLFCELFHRMRAVGLVEDAGYQFPVTQYGLADATGLTSVHTNRTLQDLRRKRLIDLSRRRLSVPDLALLERAALFDPSYLHARTNEPS